MSVARRLLLPGALIEVAARGAGWAVALARPALALPAEERARARLMGLRDGYEASRVGRHVVIDDPSRVRLGMGVRLGVGVTVMVGRSGRCEIGAGAHVMHGAVLAASGGIEIGARAAVSSGVTIHSVTQGPADGASRRAPVRIGAGALVGAGARILPGVRIGDGAALGAGAVAIRDVPPGAVAVGVPARITRRAWAPPDRGRA